MGLDEALTVAQGHVGGAEMCIFEVGDVSSVAIVNYRSCIDEAGRLFARS